MRVFLSNLVSRRIIGGKALGLTHVIKNPIGGRAFFNVREFTQASIHRGKVLGEGGLGR